MSIEYTNPARVTGADVMHIETTVLTPNGPRVLRAVASSAQYIYVFRLEGTAYYKIGVSNNPKKRRRTLSTGSPIGIEIVCAFESRDCCGGERRLHAMFAANRHKNEWFVFPEADAPSRLRQAVAKVISDQR